MRYNTLYHKLIFTGFLLSSCLFNTLAQVSIQGNITSLGDNKPLSGINIRVEGVGGLTVTSDEQGLFSITVPSEDVTLLFSYPGFKDFSFYLDGQHDLSIKMVPEDMNSFLDNVDLPSGGKQKRFIAQSLVLLNDNDFRESSVSSPERMLTGKVAGLNITSYNGAPGAGASLNLRGLNTVYAGSQPLYIIDGVPVNLIKPGIASEGSFNSSLLDINPEDIENVVVLKDVAAKGMYGARAANGVVLINTYKGAKGSSKIDFTMSFGKETMEDAPLMQDGEQNRSLLLNMAYSQYSDSALVRGIYGDYLFNDTNSIQYQKYNNNTNWLDLIKREGSYQNLHFRLRGGDDVSKYSFSVGYKNHQGVILNNDMQRLTARFNLDYNITKKIRIGNNLSFKRVTQNNQMQGYSRYNPLLLAFKKSPLTSPYVQDEEGVNTPVYEDYDIFNISNPLALVNNIRNDFYNTAISGTIFGEYAITPSLQLYADINLDYLSQQERVFIPAKGIVPFEDMKRIAVQTYGSSNLIDGKIESRYTAKLNKVHHLSSVTGTEIIDNTYKKRYNRAYNSTSDDFPNLDQQAIFDTMANSSENSRMLSFYENIDYIFKDKYLVNAVLRVDGSSRFGLNNRFIALPAIGLGWRISNEKFLRNCNWTDELKLRTSFGFTGNDNIGNFTSRFMYGPANYKNLGGVVYSQIANEKMKPEITREIDAGIDWSILGQRINLTVDAYDRLNTNMLVYGVVPLEVGFNNLVNEGKIRNRGIEISLDINSLPGSFTWNLGANLCYNKNKVIELPMSLYKSFNNFNTLIMEGQPLGVYYGYHVEGIFASDEDASAYTNGDGYTYRPFQAGDIKFADLDGNHIIDENDQTYLGKASPDLFGGIYGGIGFKGFELNILFDMQTGREIINGFKYETESLSSYCNQSANVNNRWQQDGDVTDIPKLDFNDPAGNNRFSDRWVENGSFVRLKNIKLSYNFSNQLVRKLHLQKIRLFISAENLMTFTNYSGFTPECNHLNDDIFSATDYVSIPVTKFFNGGIILGL